MYEYIYIYIYTLHSSMFVFWWLRLYLYCSTSIRPLEVSLYIKRIRLNIKMRICFYIFKYFLFLKITPTCLISLYECSSELKDHKGSVIAAKRYKICTKTAKFFITADFTCPIPLLHWLNGKTFCLSTVRIFAGLQSSNPTPVMW